MNTKAIGERIRIAREERCMSQHRLAAAAGCTASYISAIERGEKMPNLETFVAIASALSISADVLLQDVMPDWWENWEKEIDRVLAPLLPHNRAYIKSQIIEYHQLSEACAQMGFRLPQK